MQNTETPKESQDFFSLKVSSLDQQKAFNELFDSLEETENTIGPNDSQRLKEDDIVDGVEQTDKKNGDQVNDDASSSVISSSVDDCMSPARKFETQAPRKVMRPVRPQFALSKLQPKNPNKILHDEKTGNFFVVRSKSHESLSSVFSRVDPKP